MQSAPELSNYGLNFPRGLEERYYHDLDGTILTNLRPELLPGVKSLLLRLHQEGYQLFICSYNSSAQDIIWQCGLLPLFTAVQGGVSGSKVWAIQELARVHALPLDQCRFFDDTLNNVFIVR
jgi:phosphoglycolate phosphatase-like HAD superfamily hydrolase